MEMDNTNMKHLVLIMAKSSKPLTTPITSKILLGSSPSISFSLTNENLREMEWKRIPQQATTAPDRHKTHVSGAG